MAEEFKTDSSVRSYHVYQGNWTPIIGKQLNCEREDENPRDRYGVAIKRSGNIIGHVPSLSIVISLPAVFRKESSFKYAFFHPRIARYFLSESSLESLSKTV